MQGTHLARLTVYRSSTQAGTLTFFFFLLFYFPFFSSHQVLLLVVAVLAALTCVSLHSGLHSVGNRNIAQVGSSVLKIINMNRTEGYVCASFSYN